MGPRVAAILRIGVGIRKTEREPVGQKRIPLEFRTADSRLSRIARDDEAGYWIEVAGLQVFILRVVDREVQVHTPVKERRLYAGLVAPDMFGVVGRSQFCLRRSVCIVASALESVRRADVCEETARRLIRKQYLW